MFKARHIAFTLLFATALSLPASPSRAGLFDFDHVPGLVAGMVFVEGGCYVMGDRFESGYFDEKPTHEVCVDDFYMGKYEVTVAAFRQFVEDTGHVTNAERGGGCKTLSTTVWPTFKNLNWRDPGFHQKDTSPVVCVNHDDALAYARWKSKKYRKKYRLPTEAEWEFASRSRGKNYLYPWGNNPDEPAGNIYDNAAHRNIGPIAELGDYFDGHVNTAPIARFAPNMIGIHDMAGNVWEWTGDYYGKDYYRNSPRTSPTGPQRGETKVIRGGSWFSKHSCVRTSKRSKLPPMESYTIVGFRLVMESE